MRAISSRSEIELEADKAVALSLLYAAAERPSVQDIQALAQNAASSFSISHLPEHKDGQDVWLELLVNGLTFDLHGLAPGPAVKAPRPVQAFGLDELSADVEYEALTISLGPHIAGGDMMHPVLRMLAWLGTQLAVSPACKALVWRPARTIIGTDYFVSSINRWLEGGAFPGLGLTSLRPDPDNGLSSRGLAVFVGQELRLEPELAAKQNYATKLALRIMDELVRSGKLEKTTEISGLNGEGLLLEPSVNGKFVRVRPLA